MSMARKKTTTSGNGMQDVEDYRHTGTKRKNNPPAKIAAEGIIPLMPRIKYAYSPRRPPTLRFDSTSKADQLPELLAEATHRPLSKNEVRVLAVALRTQEPWLEWAGKRESQAFGFAVDPVALHIHERISAQAILKVAARKDVQRSLFGDPEQEYHEAVQFYRHDIDWTNRLILGDSLQVMASLARREDLSGKVQMIYIDPPYGIKFRSNFQPEVGRRDVKDQDADLTREPEMVKAYRDTWHLGVHSYLSYLRDRLVISRELLSDSGSVFVQIGDENVHRVRELLDNIFGPEHFACQIAFTKGAAGLESTTRLSARLDYLLWYVKDIEAMKYRNLYVERGDSAGSGFNWIESPTGERRRMYAEERAGWEGMDGIRVFQDIDLTKPGPGAKYGVEAYGKEFDSGKRWWGTPKESLQRALRTGRVMVVGNKLRLVRYLEETGDKVLNNLWDGLGGQSDPVYVVQTNTEVVKRCMLLTTDPGDLIIDPTCGSGTTAYVAEQWGRRWITIDTSRVAVSVARQRLLTAKYDYYRLLDEKGGVSGNFKYRTISHITLKSIAQNTNLDPICAKHEPIVEERLAACNAALPNVTQETRRRLELKLINKQRAGGKRSITDADLRRWELPQKGQKWEHWTVPFDTDFDWPTELFEAVAAYRRAWRARMDEVNACIAANAEQEELLRFR
jgi:adenine-specific DNA-methyltransferase